MIILEEKFDGHIILYCKGHYNLKDVDFITGLQRIWAVRCGLAFEHISGSFNEYMADKLHEIFAKCNPKKLPYFHQIMNKGLCDEWNYGNLNAIERVIMIYRDELSMLQIKESKAKLLGKPMSGYKTLIKLPKPQKRLFKRIVSGKGQYNDYQLVK
jgi:hypothetical protein